MNCIIVDDKTSSRHLEECVSKCSSLNLVGTFHDPESAIDHLSKRQNIDLVFIDIMSAGLDSFDRIGTLDDPPNIIVVTSTGEYAFKAFDYNVVDYLIKPINYSRFSKAVERSSRYNSKRLIINSNDDKEVFIKKESSLVKLKIKDIIYVEANENYVTLVTRGKKFTILFTMKGIENQLPSDIFIRSHRSFIVNKRMIKKISENSLDLIVGDTIITLPVGKSYRTFLLSEINIMDSKYLSSQIRVPVDNNSFNPYEKIRLLESEPQMQAVTN